VFGFGLGFISDWFTIYLGLVVFVWSWFANTGWCLGQTRAIIITFESKAFFSLGGTPKTFKLKFLA
jgi:hypothetical protein